MTIKPTPPSMQRRRCRECYHWYEVELSACAGELEGRCGHSPIVTPRPGGASPCIYYRHYPSCPEDSE